MSSTALLRARGAARLRLRDGALSLASALAVGGIGAAAALYTVAFPPYEWAIAAWLVPGILLATARRLPPLTAAIAGVLFGCLIGWGVSGWMPGALLDYFDADPRQAWATAAAAWLLYVGLPNGALTLTYALAARRLPAAALAPVGAWLWVASEWLRSTMLTGMPWELLGYSQFQHLPLIQVADLAGVYAVSFVIALVSIAVVELVAQVAAGTTVGALRRLMGPALSLGAVLAYGFVAAAAWDRPVGHADARTVAVVQGNVPNAFRWQRAYFERALGAYVDLSMSAPRGVDLLVWPENAVNFYVEREPSLRAPLASVAGLSRGGLLFGGPRAAGPRAAHNSAYLMAPGGRVGATYDKRRLVPFAEYDPLHPSGGVLGKSNGTVYLPGNSAAPLPAANLKLGVSICYEALFPGLIRDAVRQGADVLVNISNDSWLDDGRGAAPRQHFSMAVLRAVETRRYLVRAAASGISGFVTPYGRPYATLPVGGAGVSVAAVAPIERLTPYARFGDAWVAIGGALVVLAIWHGRGRSP